MALPSYKQLVLRWRPDQGESRIFDAIASLVVVVVLLLGYVMNSIEVPERPQQERIVVPERVAKFITQKEKPKPPPPKPKPKPKPPEPKPEEPEPEKPKVERERPKEVTKPLTEKEVKARDKAAESGLLAHMSELNDLIDVQASNTVRGKIKDSDEGNKVAGIDSSVLTKNSKAGSGGVNAAKYASTAGDSQIDAAQIAAVQASLNASEQAFAEVEKQDKENGSRIRSQEEVTLVIDSHKSQLQSLYNRARRSDPSLKGKLVLAIKIMPDGSVDSVEIVSSELNNASLENRIIARVKTFKFEAKNVEPVTVNYPIEFLPY